MQRYSLTFFLFFLSLSLVLNIPYQHCIRDYLIAYFSLHIYIFYYFEWTISSRTIEQLVSFPTTKKTKIVIKFEVKYDCLFKSFTFPWNRNNLIFFWILNKINFAKSSDLSDLLSNLSLIFEGKLLKLR